MPKKKYIAGTLAAGVLLLGTAGNYSNTQNSSPETPQVQSATKSIVTNKPTAQSKPICNGTAVTSNCSVNGTNYKTYIYHPAAPEQSHNEQVVTYKKEVSGYCTLCNDGSYSPSCATGRGACSHHGGVAEWNAPRYTNTPVYSTKKVVDSPAKAAYYETIPE